MAGFEQECEEGIYCVSCLLTWWTQSFACVELECKLVNVPEKVGSRLRNVCGQLVLTALAVHLEDMKVWVAERKAKKGDIGACPFRSGYWGIGTDLEKCEPLSVAWMFRMLHVGSRRTPLQFHCLATCRSKEKSCSIPNEWKIQGL